jgi:hypothetical protein
MLNSRISTSEYNFGKKNKEGVIAISAEMEQEDRTKQPRRVSASGIGGILLVLPGGRNCSCD